MEDMMNIMEKIRERVQENNFPGVEMILGDMCPQELCEVAQACQEYMHDATDAEYELYKKIIRHCEHYAGRRRGSISRIVEQVNMRDADINLDPDGYFPEE